MIVDKKIEPVENVYKSDVVHAKKLVIYINAYLYDLIYQLLILVIHLSTENNKEEQKRDL